MPKVVPITSSADRKTYSSSNVVFDVTIAEDEHYVFTATSATYIAQHASTPVASAADGSTLVPAGASILIWGALGAKVAVIRQSIDGEATLTRAVVTD